MPACGSLTKAGHPCTRWVVNGGRCFQHAGREDSVNVPAPTVVAVTSAPALTVVAATSPPSPSAPTNAGAVIITASGVCRPVYGDRLALIRLTNPSWAAEIVAFLEAQPRFRRYLPVAALSPQALMPVADGYGRGINQALVCYVCFAGVRTAYGQKVWERVRGKTGDEIAAMGDLAPGKRETLARVARLPPIRQRADVDTLQCKGVGVGAKAHLLEHYFNDNQVVSNSDLDIRKGITEIYGLDHLATPTQVTKLAATWPKGLNHVGTMFCCAACHYSSFLTKPIEPTVACVTT